MRAVDGIVANTFANPFAVTNLFANTVIDTVTVFIAIGLVVPRCRAIDDVHCNQRRHS